MFHVVVDIRKFCKKTIVSNVWKNNFSVFVSRYHAKARDRVVYVEIDCSSPCTLFFQKGRIQITEFYFRSVSVVPQFCKIALKVAQG